MPAAPYIVMGGMQLFSGLLQSDASEKATEAQVHAANIASKTQLEMYYQTREDLAPWRDAGKSCARWI